MTPSLIPLCTGYRRLHLLFHFYDLFFIDLIFQGIVIKSCRHFTLLVLVFQFIPVLFILFINDLLTSTSSSIHSFADDTFLSSSFSFSPNEHAPTDIQLHRNILFMNLFSRYEYQISYNSMRMPFQSRVLFLSHAGALPLTVAFFSIKYQIFLSDSSQAIRLMSSPFGLSYDSLRRIGQTLE